LYKFNYSRGKNALITPKSPPPINKKAPKPVPPPVFIRMGQIFPICHPVNNNAKRLLIDPRISV